MLVLSRKLDERIIIGEDGPGQIVLTIVRIEDDTIRIGIDADKSIPVHREEVYKLIKRNALQPVKS
jgi:carbon storage regulator